MKKVLHIGLNSDLHSHLGIKKGFLEAGFTEYNFYDWQSVRMNTGVQGCQARMIVAAKKSTPTFAAGRSILAPPPNRRFLSFPPEPSRRCPHSELKTGQKLEIAIRDLGNFDYDVDKGGNIPQDVLKLDGVHAANPWLHDSSPDQVDNITEFVLVPSLTTCCFGQPPQIQHADHPLPQRQVGALLPG